MDKKQIEQMKKDAVDCIITHWASNEDLAKSPKILVKGEGCYLYDIEGRKYLDTFASLLTTICGHGRTEIIEAAGSDDNKAALRANTDEAVARGAFGAPSLFVGDQLFWGNDRINLMLEHIKTL